MKHIIFIGCMGDTQFHFRIRQSPGRRLGSNFLATYNKDCPAALQVNVRYVVEAFFCSDKIIQ
mgnify:CR=1 FL=1